MQTPLLPIAAVSVSNDCRRPRFGSGSGRRLVLALIVCGSALCGCFWAYSFLAESSATTSEEQGDEAVINLVIQENRHYHRIHMAHAASQCFILIFIPLRFRQLRLGYKMTREFKKKCLDDANIRPGYPNAPKLNCFMRLMLWIYWLLMLIQGAALVQSALPEIIINVMDKGHEDFVQTCFVASGIYLMWWKTNLMELQTLDGNALAVREEGLNDIVWAHNMLLSTSSNIALILVMVYQRQWTISRLWEHRTFDERCFDLHRRGWEKVAIVLAIFDLSFLIARLCHIICRCATCWKGHYQQRGFLLWGIRTREVRGNKPVSFNALQIYMTSIAPGKIWDRYGLDDRMSQRLDHHCCIEWAATHNRRYITMPEIMKEEMDMLQMPAVNDVDPYTRIMLYSVKKVTVELGRLEPLFISDVKLPWPKEYFSLKHTEKAGVAGILIPYWDEQYSDENGKRQTESSSWFKWQLSILHAFFPAVESPRQFLHELEGVLTYEAVVAPFAAGCNTVWTDLTSDEAIEKMVFYGIGQFLLSGRGSEAFNVLEKCKAGPDICSDTEYVIDYTWMSNYEVRKRYAKFGFAACFDKKKELRHIFVCHWSNSSKDPWIRRPGKNIRKDDDHKKKWEHAKYVIKASLGAGVTLKDHLLYCHWIVANSASLALRATLDKDHPIRRLMHTFVLRTPSINYASTLTLLPKDRFVHRASGLEFKDMCKMLDEGAQDFKYQTFPEALQERRIGHLENELPWAQDGKRFWAVVHEFVKVVVALFYDTDREIVEDEDLQNFWTLVGNLPSGPEEEGGMADGSKAAEGYGYKLPPLNDEATARDNLVNYLSHVIMFVTAQHEFFGALAEYFTTPMGLTVNIWNEEVKENGIDECGQIMADIQTYMQSLCIVSATGYPQPRLMSDWQFLMHLQEDDANATKWKLEQTSLGERRERIIEEYLYIIDERNRSQYDAVVEDDSLNYNVREISNRTMLARWQSNGAGDIDDDFKFNSRSLKVVLPWKDLVEERDHRSVQNILLSYIHAAFMENLWRLDCEIKRDNETRAQKHHPFEAFRPTNLECSVNI